MSPSPKKKRKRTVVNPVKQITIAQKLEVIEKRDNGARWIKMALDKGMSESTVRTIYAQKDEIRARGKVGAILIVLLAHFHCPPKLRLFRQ